MSLTTTVRSISRITLPVFAVVMSTGGCATILQGTRQRVQIESSPPGAEVLIRGRSVGMTPMTVKLDRSERSSIRLERQDYEAASHTVVGTIGVGWVVANVLLSGLIGLVVDGATESWYQYPKQVHVALTPEPHLSPTDLARTPDRTEGGSFAVVLEERKWHRVESLGARVRFDPPSIGSPFLQLGGDARASISPNGPFEKARVALHPGEEMYVATGGEVYAVRGHMGGTRLVTNWRLLPTGRSGGRSSAALAWPSAVETASREAFEVVIAATGETELSQLDSRVRYAPEGASPAGLHVLAGTPAAVKPEGPYEVRRLNVFEGRIFYLQSGTVVYEVSVRSCTRERLRLRITPR